MQAGHHNDESTQPEDETRDDDIAIKPGYIVRPIGDRQYQLPLVLAGEDLSLAAVQVPDFTEALD